MALSGGHTTEGQTVRGAAVAVRAATPVPSGYDDTTGIDRVFRALADPHRRQLLDSLNAESGQSLRQLCEGLHMTRQAVSKHLAVLEGANLVTTARRGRQKLHYLNPVPINEIAERWINHYERPRVAVLADLKRALEER
jgi:DNA-binding transcriptional ArsR family regulator